MRIPLLASAFNSLTQRVFAELADRGQTLVVALAEGEESVREAVRRNAPDLVLAPMLKTAIPEDVRSARVSSCIPAHPVTGAPHHWTGRSTRARTTGR